MSAVRATRVIDRSIPSSSVTPQRAFNELKAVDQMPILSNLNGAAKPIRPTPRNAAGTKFATAPLFHGMVLYYRRMADFNQCVHAQVVDRPLSRIRKTTNLKQSTEAPKKYQDTGSALELDQGYQKLILTSMRNNNSSIKT